MLENFKHNFSDRVSCVCVGFKTHESLKFEMSHSHTQAKPTERGKDETTKRKESVRDVELAIAARSLR